MDAELAKLMGRLAERSEAVEKRLEVIERKQSDRQAQYYELLALVHAIQSNVDKGVHKLDEHNNRLHSNVDYRVLGGILTGATIAAGGIGVIMKELWDKLAGS